MHAVWHLPGNAVSLSAAVPLSSAAAPGCAGTSGAWSDTWAGGPAPATFGRTGYLCGRRGSRLSAPKSADRLPQRRGGGEHRRGLVAAVRHAIRAARIPAPAVGVPVGGLDQFLVGLGVAVGHQVARPLPAEQRVGRNAPRRATEVGLALKEVQEQRSVVQPPPSPVPVGERLAEQLPGLGDAEEVLLVGSLLVGVRGRDLHVVDLQVVVEVVEYVDDRVRGVGVEEGGVGVHPEPAPLAFLDGGNGLVENAFLADGLVVPVAQSVDVDDPGEVRRGLELVQFLRDQQRVGAQEHELLALDELIDDHVNLRVHQWLAARYRDHGRAALFDGPDGLLDRHPLLQQAGGLLNLAAPSAFEVAGEQRLELYKQRELLLTRQLLAHQVAANSQALTQWHRHDYRTSFGRPN